MNKKNKAFIVIDLGFGDSGKGAITDSLVRRYNSDLTVRFSGGPQCAHFVHTDDGISHCFSQFGSGTLAGARTYLGPEMLINPLTLEIEAKELIKKGVKNPYENLYIDENCIIITPFHQAFNRLLEISRGKGKHGSCGHGVWEAVKDNKEKGEDFTLRVKDLFNELMFVTKLDLIQNFKKYESFLLLDKFSEYTEDINNCYSILSDGNLNNHDLRYKYLEFVSKINIIKDNGKSLINSSCNPIFEGNQGVLLDDEYGFHPYSTPTKTTSEPAVSLLNKIDFTGNVERIGVIRTYGTRHGDGPFPTETPECPGLFIEDDDNSYNQWQGSFREGWLDLALIYYAIQLNDGIDYLAVTHVDKLSLRDTWPVCIKYSFNGYNFSREELEYLPEPRTENIKKLIPQYEYIAAKKIIDFISDYLGVKIKIISKGKKYSDKEFYE